MGCGGRASAPPGESRQGQFERDAACLRAAQPVRAVIVAALVAGFSGRVDGHLHDDLGAVDVVGLADPAASVVYDPLWRGV